MPPAPSTCSTRYFPASSSPCWIMGHQEYHGTAPPGPNAVPTGKLAYSQTAGALSKRLATQLLLLAQPHLPSTQMSRPVWLACAVQSDEVVHCAQCPPVQTPESQSVPSPQTH